MPTSTSSPDNANVIAPAPVFYVVLFLLGLAAHYFIPLPVFSNVLALVVGLLLIIASIPIVLSAVLELRKAGTAFDARKTSTALVTGGAFRFSRNPTYLSMTMLFAGFALVVNSLIALLSVVIAALLTQIFVIQPEERYIAAKFGDAYQQYKQSVRRWI